MWQCHIESPRQTRSAVSDCGGNAGGIGCADRKHNEFYRAAASVSRREKGIKQGEK